MKKWFYLVAIAFAIRLVGLNQSLWLDEAVVAQSVGKFGYLELITKFAPADFHPPLYYLLLKAWTAVFGTSEIALRLPSIIFSLGAGVLLYSLAGFWASAFLLFNPLFVYYSQEARMYTMVTFLLLLAYWAVRRKQLLLAGVAVCLAFWSFYGAIFFILALILWQFLEKKYLTAALLLFAIGVAILLLSPLLYLQYLNSLSLRGLVVNWSAVLGAANLKNLLLNPLKFAGGRISFKPKAVYYLLFAGWAAVVWIAALKGALKTAGRRVAWLLGVPLVLGGLFSLFTPLLQYFRFLYLLPFLSLLLAFGIPKYWQRGLVLGVFIILSLVYLLLPQFHREDWKSLSRSLPKNAHIYGIPSSLEGVRYYRPELLIGDVREDKLTAKNVWLIPYTFEIYGLNGAQLLEKQAYRLTGTTSFRELTLESWQK